MVPRCPLRGRRGTAVMLETARLQWDEGVGRLEDARHDETRYLELVGLVDAVVDELRRRVGQTFTLAELADAYDGAEEWVREVVVGAMRPRAAAGVSDTALVQDAAFGLFARGAVDFRP